MQSIAASKAAKEMFKAFRTEQRRQRGFANEATGAFDPYLQSWSSENAGDQIAAGAEGRMGAYDRIGNAPLSYHGGGSNFDKMHYQMAGQARANLGGYADWMQGQNIGELHAHQGINDIIDKAGGQARVFPYEMDAASHSWDDLAFWGQLISSIGGSAGSWGQAFGSNPPTQQQQSGSGSSIGVDYGPLA